MKVQKKGFDEFAATLKSGAKVVKRELVKAINNSVTVVQIAAKAGVPEGATGNLKRSITAHVDQSSLIGIVGLDAPGRQYGLYVERGSRPHWVPRQALERWASQRGIPVFLVQRAIARKGTKPQPFMEPAYKNNRKFIERQFQTANKNIVQSLKNGD